MASAEKRVYPSYHHTPWPIAMTDESIDVARELQRQVSAFGSARTPLNEILHDERVVVAGSQLFSVPKEWTFQEFLIGYGKSTLGKDWLRQQLDTDEPGRHPLAHHFFSGFQMTLTRRRRGELHEFKMNGDLYAFMAFAYDMFTLSDNATIQASLLRRVLHEDQYHGARYEIFAAASLLRAGFSIAFENEKDSRTSHCEFTATSKTSKRSFSVEAKSRYRDTAKFERAESPPAARMYRILQDALTKNAEHERIIFADVNLPEDQNPVFHEPWHKEVAATLNELEQRQRADDPWPQAIILFTNRKTSPWRTNGNDRVSTVLLTAINHPLFKMSDPRAAEIAYPEIGKLFFATNELCVPPAHFVGQRGRLG